MTIASAAPPVGARLAPARLARSLVFADDLPIVYLQNAKAGCTTVKMALWQWLNRARGITNAAGSPHYKGPFTALHRTSLSPGAIVSQSTFSMVRNPYARAFSAYLSKVAPPGDPRVWGPCRIRFGLAPDEVPTFARFLDLIGREPPEALDPHFAPQYLNLLQPAARIDRVFYLEEVSALETYLAQTLSIPMPRFERNRRDAVGKLGDGYGAVTRKQVRRLYARDFELFGYDEDLARQAPDRAITALPGIEGALEAALATLRGPRVDRRAAAERLACLAGDDHLVDLMRLKSARSPRARYLLAERIAAAAPLDLAALEAAEEVLAATNHPDAAHFTRHKTAALAALRRA